MGLLVDGIWQDQWYDTSKTGGKFKRTVAQFRSWITSDGNAGPSGIAGFKAERDRYHLYVSYACPWANRTLAVKTLKGLDDYITVDVVHPIMLGHGWTFDHNYSMATGDSLHNHKYLHQVYTQVDPQISTRVTVPILWDKKQRTIVSNESSEIIRMFNTAFDHLTGSTLDLYPESLRADIDTINERVYHDVNNGVYLAGFATSQEAYNEAIERLFNTLDWLDEHLSSRKFLIGETLTEADIRLAMTLFRFDPVYVQHFKTDKKRVVDYQHLWPYARRIYQWPGIANTVHFDHIREHYFKSHPTINPHAIIPVGADIDWWASSS